MIFHFPLGLCGISVAVICKNVQFDILKNVLTIVDFLTCIISGRPSTMSLIRNVIYLPLRLRNPRYGDPMAIIQSKE